MVSQSITFLGHCWSCIRQRFSNTVVVHLLATSVCLSIVLRRYTQLEVLLEFFEAIKQFLRTLGVFHNEFDVVQRSRYGTISFLIIKCSYPFLSQIHSTLKDNLTNVVILTNHIQIKLFNGTEFIIQFIKLL